MADATGMRRWSRTTARMGKAALLPALIALGVVVVLGIFADRQQRVLHKQQMRAEVLNRMGVVRAKLEGNIGANLQLARGLAAIIANDPEITQERFARLAASLMVERSQLRNLAGAPGLKVSLLYPLEGNESVLGLDYAEAGPQWAAVQRARDSGELVLAGPVDLVQGGRGLIGRFPVFTTVPDGNRRFWGVLSAVVDLDLLYAESGLFDPHLDIALIGRDGLGGVGGLFHGDRAVLAGDPVVSQVMLPQGSWVMAAVPRGGWDAHPPRSALLRVMIALGGFLVVMPIMVTGLLYEERQAYIRELRRRERELERLSRRLGLALDTSQIGVWEMDLVSAELVWDDRMNELYGYPADGGPRGYRHWHDRLHRDDLDRAAEDFRLACETSGRYLSEYRIVRAPGEVRHIRAIGSVYSDPESTPKIVGVNWDVTADVLLAEDLRRAKTLTEARNAELEAAKARIEHTSLHDFLTGLPNRRFLEERLERIAVRCAGSGETAALLHIDLDRFKQINDTLGHAAGDAMLVHASALMAGRLAGEEVISRIGGDEFVIAITGPDAAARASALAAEIVEAMRQPVEYDGQPCRFGVSIGVACDSGAQVSRERLLINADLALYRAKSRGRNRFEFFSETLQSEVIETKRVADEILSGLERGEFRPWYQPQFDARSLRLVGVEALARWHHPEEGVLPPDRFLRIAEDLNVVSAIDRTVLEAALADLARWESAGLGVPRVSVNVSLRRLNDEGLIAHLGSLDIRPGTLSFELVESIYLDDGDDLVNANLDHIRDLGIGIEIDDFGTGYASIVSLMRLDPDRLKIDRQLVTPIAESPSQRQLVKSIVDIGKALGIEVLAEGVETMEQARILRDLGCDVLQGYVFSLPLEGEGLEQFLRERMARAV